MRTRGSTGRKSLSGLNISVGLLLKVLAAEDSESVREQATAITTNEAISGTRRSASLQSLLTASPVEDSLGRATANYWLSRNADYEMRRVNSGVSCASNH